jgi:hypothetical protein
MSNKDRNWRSFVGPEDNDRTVTADDWAKPPDPQNWDDIFKCSNVSGLTASGLTIPAAREDSFDAVRGSGYAVRHCNLAGDVTVKGAIDGATFYGCVIDGTVELGQYDNYWKPGRGPTRNVVFDACTNSNGKPIRIICWDALPPQLINTSAKVTRIPKLVWLAYFYWRRWTNQNAIK